MARRKADRYSYKLSDTSLKTSASQSKGLFERLQDSLQQNNSFINLVLGALIVIVLGVLLFNYFNKPTGDLGPAEITQEQFTQDVVKDQLPGKYQVKAGDTLFLIAQKYYDDGFKYPRLVEENKIVNENLIETGQILEIPKLEEELTKASPVPSPTTDTYAAPSDQKGGVGGAENQTIWGERITADTHTVQSGDWLSKIAGRAYGDMMAYDKIAKANNISNPDLIEQGMVLKIPR